MRNNNLVWVSCIAVVFVLTNIVLRIFLHSDNVAMGGAIGLFGGLVAVVWGSLVMKNRNERLQIRLTAMSAVTLFAAVFFYIRFEKAEEENRRTLILGLWVSPSSGQNKKDLTILFLEHDSARLWVDDEKSRLMYAIDDNKITLTDSTGVAVLKGRIEALNDENLIIRSGEFETKLKRDR